MHCKLKRIEPPDVSCLLRVGFQFTQYLNMISDYIDYEIALKVYCACI